MLQAFLPLRLLWIFSLFSVCASLCDRVKPFVPVYAGIGILILPVIATFVGEFLEESEHKSWHRSGLWTQLIASLVYASYLITALIYIDPVYKPVDRIFFTVLTTLGFLPAVLLIVDCYRGLFLNRRISVSLAPLVNQMSAMLTAGMFTITALLLMIPRASANLMPYACALFFGGCFAIGILTWWTDHQLKKPVHVMNKRRSGFIQISDVAAIGFGIAGSVLAFKGFSTNSDKAYVVGIGLLFASYCASVLVFRWRMWKGDVHSFVACREGLIDLHSTGWILYPWNAISDIALITGAGNIRVIAMNFIRPISEVEIIGQTPESKSEQFKKFVDSRTKKNQTNALFYGYDLVVHPIFCRFGIVDLWRQIEQIHIEQDPIDAGNSVNAAEALVLNEDTAVTVKPIETDTPPPNPEDARPKLLTALPPMQEFVDL